MNKAKSKGWAIVFVFEGTSRHLYTGWWITRREAIKAHERDTGKPWEYHRSKGDRAVKIEISEAQGPAEGEKA